MLTLDERREGMKKTVNKMKQANEKIKKIIDKFKNEDK